MSKKRTVAKCVIASGATALYTAGAVNAYQTEAKGEEVLRGPAGRIIVASALMVATTWVLALL